MADSFLVYSRQNSSGPDGAIGAIARMDPDGTAQELIYTPPAVSTPGGPLRPYSTPLQGSPDGTKVLISIKYGTLIAGDTWYWTPSYFLVMSVDGSDQVRVGVGGAVGAVSSGPSRPAKNTYKGTDFGVAAGTWIDNSTVALLSQSPSDGTRKGWQICAIDGSSNTFVDIGAVSDGGASLDYSDDTDGTLFCHPDTSRLCYGFVNSGGVGAVRMANHDGTHPVDLFSDISGALSWQLLAILNGGYRYFLFESNGFDWYVKSEDEAISQHIRDESVWPSASFPAGLSPDNTLMASDTLTPTSLFVCAYDGTLDTAGTIYPDTIATPRARGPLPGFWGTCWVGSLGGVTPPPTPPMGSVTVGAPVTGLVRRSHVLGA